MKEWLQRLARADGSPQIKKAWDTLSRLAKKYRAAAIVLLAGAVLLAGGKGGAQTREETVSATSDPSFDLVSFERQLEDKVRAIEGAGRVSLMLSLEQTGETVYAVNTRQTQNSETGGSYQSDLSVISDGSYGETPVAVTTCLPEFRGAVVLCDGADNDAVRLAVTQAVSTVCGIGTDKVSVLKMDPDA